MCIRDRCLKWRAWRKLDEATGRPAPVPAGDFFCEDNEDVAFRTCYAKAEIPSPNCLEPDPRGASCVAPDGAECGFCGLAPRRDAGWRFVDPPLLKDGVAVWTHEHCLRLAPEVVRDGPYVFHGLAALRRGRAMKCSVCNKRGATVGCGLARGHTRVLPSYFNLSVWRSNVSGRASTVRDLEER